MEQICDYFAPLLPIQWRRGNIAAEVRSEALPEVLPKASIPFPSTSQVSTHVLSDFETNFVVDMPMTIREQILRLLVTSERLLDIFFIDQNEYLEHHLKSLGLELDIKYFWIFRSMDYEEWVQRHDKAKILGLRGPSTEDLELAASHVVRSLQNPDSEGQEGEVLLYFFTTRQAASGAPRTSLAGGIGSACGTY